MERLNFMDWLTGTLVTIGGLNWGLVGFFQYDLLAKLFSDGSGIYRVITAIVGLAAVYIVGAALVRTADYESRHVNV
jgi:uncharacterized protein